MKRPSYLIVLLFCVACSRLEQPIEIPFAVHYAGQPIACSSSPFTLTDLRLFVHDLRFGGAADEEIPVHLVEDGVWQNGSVALLDFEDGLGACVNGSAEMNTVVRGILTGPARRGLVFTLGVPEALNHADPLTATAPLNYTAMHWHWLSGYKFLRAGIKTAADGFWVHLGSTRCEGTVRDIKGCQSPNRATIRLPDFVPGEDSVILDLASLFAGIDLEDGSPSRCMSEADESQCAGPFTALGIAHDAVLVEPSEIRPVFLRGTRN